VTDATDFWWIDPNLDISGMSIDLVHHCPIGIDDPASLSFLKPESLPVREIGRWRDSHENSNVYRSLSLKAGDSDTGDIVGPIVLDIDNEDADGDERISALADALDATKAIVDLAQQTFSIGASDLRLFYSGHKGFNIEIAPGSLTVSSSEQFRERHESLRSGIINGLRTARGLSATEGRNFVSKGGTVIDPFHEFVRLHGSVNRWRSPKGLSSRRRVALALDELRNLSINDMEVLARV
jgi:hypothetical protein